MDLAQSTSITPQKMVTPNFGSIPESLNQILNIQRGKVELEKNKQSLAANQAVSDAIQKNTDANGNINIPSIMQMLSQNPNAAYNLPQIATQLQNMQAAKFTALNNQIENAKKQNDYWNGRLGGLLQKGEKLSRNDVIGELVSGVERGVISVTQAQQELAKLPKEDKDLLSYVKEHHFSTLENAKQLEMIMPSKEVMNPITKQKELVSPAELMGYTTPKQELLSESGRFITGLSPSESSAQTTSGSNQANAAQELHASVASAPTRINILESARQNLENPDLSTGPGVEGRNQIKSFFAALSPELIEKIFGKEFTGVIKDQEEFKKYMTQYANFASSGLGTGTDARLNASLTGNPNPNILKMSNQDLLTKTIAIEKMNKAQDYAWQNSGISPDKFNQWQSQWNKQVKPEVFAFASMTPSQQKDFIERKNKDGSLGVFKKDLTNMVKQGFLESPGQ